MITVSKNISKLSNGEVNIYYSVQPERIEYQLALNAITSWNNKNDLLQFALERHGYCNTDSMSGITYPSDLDDFDRDVDKITINEGFILVYSEQFTPKEAYLTEEDYLTILNAYFKVSKNTK